jgi:hypothetical protein
MASQIVWLDAYITNVDRTFRNTNMLIWHKLWLIDHGASYIFITLGLIGKSMPKVLLPNQRPRIVAASVSAG